MNQPVIEVGDVPALAMPLDAVPAEVDVLDEDMLQGEAGVEAAVD